VFVLPTVCEIDRLALAGNDTLMKKRNLDAMYRAFGKLVRLGRERRDLSQEELGRFVGLSRTSIVNIEKGRHHLVIHQLLAFARALEVPPRSPIAVDASDGTASRRAENSRGQE
jgi:transcriptional regulator with XRE-family HTH domain